MDTNYLENTKKINKDDKESGGQCQVEGNNVQSNMLTIINEEQPHIWRNELLTSTFKINSCISFWC